MTIHLIAQQHGQRADLFLAKVLPELTRSAAQKLMEEGRVYLEDKPLKKNKRLEIGDQITVVIPDPVPLEAKPEDIPLDVVFEDEDVIVINKPVGLVVHPAPGHPDGTLVNALLHHCGDSLSGISGVIRPGIVHRIDRDTSGLLIVAKNDAAHLALADQLRDHSLYLAVDHLSGRPAVTHWTVLERFSGYTHLQCRLETGRTHQIRVHLAHEGHPVLGDPVYGGVRKGFPELEGQCLHARKLSFIHPRTGERITVESPLPDYFTATLTRCARLQ